MKNQSKKIIVTGGVEEYIAACPKVAQSNLKQLRSAIRQVAPDAHETVSYFQFPGYYYEGYDYNGMFVWFSYKKPYVRLHVRPPVLQDNKKALEEYPTTKAVVSFPEHGDLPIALIKKLVIASLNVMKDKA